MRAWKTPTHAVPFRQVSFGPRVLQSRAKLTKASGKSLLHVFRKGARGVSNLFPIAPPALTTIWNGQRKSAGVPQGRFSIGDRLGGIEVSGGQKADPAGTARTLVHRQAEGTMKKLNARL